MTGQGTTPHASGGQWPHRRGSWRALLLVAVWASAGLWDVAHAVEHQRDHHHASAASVEATQVPQLTVEARQGHDHSHPPEDQPVVGSARGPELEVASLPAWPVVFEAESSKPAFESETTSNLLRRASVAATGPRAPPITWM